MPNQQMLINHVHDEESRIALVEDGRLEELYTERASADLHVGNIYRGRVTNIEPSIQAAFVDFGEDRAGFLHITDLHPRYFPASERESSERIGHKTPRKERPPIQKSLKRGQEILVQVLKEGIGGKGPTLTSYLSIPGRYLVMLPHMERHGVSRKVEDPEQRREMLKLMDELSPPQDMGFIIRTAGMSRPKTELKRDLNYLIRLWKNIDKRSRTGRGPAELYTESDLVIRTLRDVLTTDVKRIVVDERVAALRARDFLRIAMPRSNIKVYHYNGSVPLFDAFDVERQIQLINQRQVPLDCGGSLVFDSTEALVAVDVNSGRFRDTRDPEETAYRTNKEAIDEIARQLRLRDLGGLLVLDLIDMYVNRHRRDIERRFRTNLKKDRARTKVLKISELGMLEMTRQRMRPSLKKSVYDECGACGGTGQILSPESAMLEAMRRLAVAISAKPVARVELAAHPKLLTMLLNRRRSELVQLERETGKTFETRYDPEFSPDRFELACFDSKGGRVELEKLPQSKKPELSSEEEVKLDDLKELERLLHTESRLQHEEAAPDAEQEEQAEQAEPTEQTEEGGEPKKKKRRRRGGRRRRKSSASEAEAATSNGDGNGEQRDTGPTAETETATSGDGKAEDQRTEQRTADPGAKTEKKETGDRQSSRTEHGEGETAGGENGSAENGGADGGRGGEGGGADSGGGESGGGGEKPKRRRRRRGGRRRRKSSASQEDQPAGQPTEETGSTEGATDKPAAAGSDSGEPSSTESDKGEQTSSPAASASGGYERGPGHTSKPGGSLDDVLHPVGGDESADRNDASGNGAAASEGSEDDSEDPPSSRRPSKVGRRTKGSSSKRGGSRGRKPEPAAETAEASTAETGHSDRPGGSDDSAARAAPTPSSAEEQPEEAEPPRVTRGEIPEAPAASPNRKKTKQSKKAGKTAKAAKTAKTTKKTKKTKKTTKKTKKTAARTGASGSSQSQSTDSSEAAPETGASPASSADRPDSGTTDGES